MKFKIIAFSFMTLIVNNVFSMELPTAKFVKEPFVIDEKEEYTDASGASPATTRFASPATAASPASSITVSDIDDNTELASKLFAQALELNYKVKKLRKDIKRHKKNGRDVGATEPTPYRLSLESDKKENKLSLKNVLTQLRALSIERYKKYLFVKDI